MTDIIVKLTETTPVVGKIDGKASEVSINAHNTSETSHTDIRGQLSAIDAEIAEKANKVQEAWIFPTILNGWIDINPSRPVGYYKDETGIVRLRGRLSTGSTSLPPFILPSGYFVGSSQYFSASSDSGFAKLTVNFAGNIICSKNDNISLDGISFRV